MLRYLSADVVLREVNNFPRVFCKLRGTDTFQEQISEEILKSNGGYCVYFPSNAYCNTKIEEYSSE